MTERGVSVDHSTINRWVNKFSPLLEAEARRRQMLGLGRWVVSEKWLCASYLQPQLFETAQAILRKNAKFNHRIYQGQRTYFLKRYLVRQRWQSPAR